MFRGYLFIIFSVLSELPASLAGDIAAIWADKIHVSEDFTPPADPAERAAAGGHGVAALHRP